MRKNIFNDRPIKRTICYNVDDNSPIVVKNLADYQGDNHHIYKQEQTVYKTLFMRNRHIYRRTFSLLKDAIDYRDACLRISPTPKSRGRARGGNTKQWHSMFNICVELIVCYRVILATTNGKIRKSFASLELAREWRDNEIKRRGVVEPNTIKTNLIQSYSPLGDKSCVLEDSDNIRDQFDNIEFGEWEEFQ